jgi:hypothetical protein
MLMGSAVSLVSVRTRAPSFTEYGELVSEVCRAWASTCAVSSDWIVTLAGGGTAAVCPLSPPQALIDPAAIAAAPKIAILCFTFVLL